MKNFDLVNESPRFSKGGGPAPGTIQRIESGLIAAFALIATFSIDRSLWWFPLILFLVFDLSALGYLKTPNVGAFWYNAIHTYTWPAILGVIVSVTVESSPSLSRWLALIALAWAFHIGVDRMLGYGIKLPDAFGSTHLGKIGRIKPNTADGK